jgi:hypothetical protein
MIYIQGLQIFAMKAIVLNIEDRAEYWVLRTAILLTESITRAEL